MGALCLRTLLPTLLVFARKSLILLTSLDFTSFLRHYLGAGKVFSKSLPRGRGSLTMRRSDMPKGSQRFNWSYNPVAGTTTVVDKVTQESLTFDVAAYPEDIAEHFAPFGLSAYMKTRNSDVDSDSKMEGYAALHAQFIGGKFKSDKAAGERLVPAYILAIANSLGCEPGIAQRLWRDADKAKREETVAALTDEIAAIEAARKDAKSDEFTLDDLTP